MKFLAILSLVGFVAFLAFSIGSLSPVTCRMVWSDNHVASRYAASGCEINENDGLGWKSEWLYRGTDPKLPALRRHMRSNNFGGY